MNEAAKMLHVALAGRRQHGAGTEEQQALEDTVIEDVEQSRGHGERGCRRHRVRLEGERKAEPDEHDADILDRAVGKEPLQVALEYSREQADYRGRASKYQHRYAPPPLRRAEKIEDDTDEAVDRDLGHDAAHQRRHTTHL